MTAKSTMSSQIRSRTPNLPKVPSEYLETILELQRLLKSFPNAQSLARTPSMVRVTQAVNPHKDDDHV